MPEPTVSETARRVAAYRLGFERLGSPTADGDPDADQRLTADVAEGLTVDRSGPMGRYLRARTAFFDRVVVNALTRHVAQFVVVGAGYDGRAQRYAAPGVRWWELDRPLTQSDKRARLARLAIASPQVTFVALDLDDGGVADALIAAGFEPDAPALFIAEGVAPYLGAETLHLLLADLRAVATPGTRLALSLRRRSADPTELARFESGVAAVGEPAIGSLTAESAPAVLAGCRWRPVQLKERSAAAGFVVALPEFVPARDGVPPTRGSIGTFVEQRLSRRGGDTLGDHLHATYGVPVVGVRELDVGVHRVERADGSVWVARVFPGDRSIDAVRGDADLLDLLVRAGIPAERTAAPEPVSTHEGQGVLVTEFAPGRQPAASPALFEELGDVVARIHGVPADRPPADRAGGAWHHLLFDATPVEELAAARELLHQARHRVPRGQTTEYDLLHDALAGLTLPPDLPTALVHPDVVTRNLRRTATGDLTVLDWAGAGRGPRLVSLGCLLWSAAGHGPSVDAVARGYRATVTVEPTESAHLAAAMAVRPLVLAVWAFATGRSSLSDAASGWAGQQRRIAKVADRARSGLQGD